MQIRYLQSNTTHARNNFLPTILLIAKRLPIVYSYSAQEGAPAPDHKMWDKLIYIWPAGQNSICLSTSSRYKILLAQSFDYLALQRDQDEQKPNLEQLSDNFRAIMDKLSPAQKYIKVQDAI